MKRKHGMRASHPIIAAFVTTILIFAAASVTAATIEVLDGAENSITIGSAGFGSNSELNCPGLFPESAAPCIITGIAGPVGITASIISGIALYENANHDLPPSDTFTISQVLDGQGHETVALTFLSDTEGHQLGTPPGITFTGDETGGALPFLLPSLCTGCVDITVSLTSDKDPTVPEPTTLALFGLGLAGLGFSRRRKTK